MIDNHIFNKNSANPATISFKNVVSSKKVKHDQPCHINVGTEQLISERTTIP